MGDAGVPVPLPPPALLKWELELDDGPIDVPTPPPAPTAIDALAAQDAAESRRFSDETLVDLGIDPNQARQDALDILTGKTAVPAWGAPSSPPVEAVDIRPVNGGPGAWAGTAVGTSVTLPMIPRPFGPPAPETIRQDLKVLWNGTKWVATKAGKAIGVVKVVMTTVEIYQWAKKHWPEDRPLPNRIPTRYEFGSNRMLYEHPGAIWLSYPPQGYDNAGTKMW